jgi:hypothetical protein
VPASKVECRRSKVEGQEGEKAAAPMGGRAFDH